MIPPTTYRRVRRQRRQILSPLAHIPWQRIQNYMPPVEPLSTAEIERVHEASLQILENTGIAFMDNEALDLWEAAGASVDRAEQIVKIDRYLLLDLVKKAPSSFTWRARNPDYNVFIGGNHITFNPNGGVIFMQSLDTPRRPGTLDDYHKLLKLVQMCNVLHFAGEQLIVPHDIPVSFRHLRRSLAALQLSDKAYQEAAHGRVIPADSIKMAQIVFGENITESDQPVVGGVVNSSSPLRYDDRMIGGMITYGRANQVVIVTPFILAGAVSPITMAAAITQQNAEALAGIAFIQLVRAGAPVLYGGFATNIDMKTGSPSFGTPEGAWAMMVGAQLARHYNLPYRGSGSLNTSKLPDAQASYETMWSIWPAVIAHTNFVNHAIGWLEGGLTVSLEKIIIDMESLAMFQHLLQPVVINDETLALDSIDEVGTRGHHFATAHTQARYSTEYYAPFLSDRQNFETWRENGAEDAASRANKIWKTVLKDYEAPALDEGINEALVEYVERRERELYGVELYT